MTTSRNDFFIYDLIFISLVAAFAILTYLGIARISANGLMLDSDLQTYAQGMAGAHFPDLFINDPVLHSKSAANSIVNMERILGGFLSQNNNFGAGLLKAGSIAIFIFYISWYFLGRYLFKSPALSSSLALACGITIWVGFGTFWGATHSDPVPRVFFAAIFPLLLLCAIYSCKKAAVRPICMFLTGVSIWVHGISALNCGAMFFLAFIFIKPAGYTLRVHIINLAYCLAAFLIPVLVFLWPSLIQKQIFEEKQLALFREVFELRWQEDYGDIPGSLNSFFLCGDMVTILLASGAGCWIITLLMGNAREKILCRMLPLFIAALVLVTTFTWLESIYAPKLGRLPMGHELVRGIRFLIPLSWLMVVSAIGCITGRILRRFVLLGTLALVLVFNIDRQYMGFQYEIYELTGLELPLVPKAKEEMAETEKYKMVMEEIHRLVPAGETVFSDGEDMAVRYYANRPLIHSFKDGYAHFYNKDYEASKKWLEFAEKMSAGNSLDAWLASGAPWYLTHSSEDKQKLLQYGKIMYDQNGWMLIHRI